MIDKNFNLSCYALEHPFQIYYSKRKEMVELVDVNNDIYQFRLPDHQHYEKVQANWRVMQYYRFDHITFLLYQTNDFFILRNQEPPSIIQNVGQVGIYLGKDTILFFLKFFEEEPGHNAEVRAVVVRQSQQKKGHSLQLKKWELSRVVNEHEQYVAISIETIIELASANIEYFFGEHCILKTKSKNNLLIKLNLQNLEDFSHLIRYQLVDIKLPSNIEIVGANGNTLMFVNLDDSQNKDMVYLLNADISQILPLRELKTGRKKKNYIISQKFLIVIDQMDLLFFQIVKGTFMAKISIIFMLQQFEEGSSVIIGMQHQKQPRYQLLFDHLNKNIQQFFVADKERMSIYSVKIAELLNSAFRNTMRINLGELSIDSQQIHDNVMKTMNFRVKKLKTLQEYLSEGIKTLSFGNTFRFLQNEQNIFVLNDGLFLFFNAIQLNFQRLTKQKQTILESEKQIIKLCDKLINSSKYQDHIAKGLMISNTLFTDFRNKTQILTRSDNFSVYEKLVESKRVSKLLKQEKNKELFQLSYQLAIAIKGFNYLEEMEKKKK